MVNTNSINCLPTLLPHDFIKKQEDAKRLKIENNINESIEF